MQHLIEPLLEDPEVTEILLNGPHHIVYEKAGHLIRLTQSFASEESFEKFLQDLFLESRLHPNLDIPYADGQWRQFRLHCIIPPLAKHGTHISLRRHPDNPWSLSRLSETQWAPPVALDLLQKSLNEKRNILIIGATGSGKTSVLNACLQALPQNERVVILEDTQELTPPNTFSTQLLTRFDFNQVLRPVDLTELLRQSLRMRPDRIVLGEVRGAEAKDLLMALSTGHRGGLCSLHADHARQALFRLEMLVQIGAPQWSLKAIRHLILYGVDLIVTVEKINGERKLKNISRIASLEDSGFCLEPLYELNL